jgi:adenosine deaminase
MPFRRNNLKGYSKKQGKWILYFAHAGEAAGAKYLGRCKEFKANRIGHGTRAYEDSALVEYF